MGVSVRVCGCAGLWVRVFVRFVGGGCASMWASLSCVCVCVCAGVRGCDQGQVLARVRVCVSLCACWSGRGCIGEGAGVSVCVW